MKALAVGGMRDHIHVLLSLPPTMAIAKAMQLLTSGSSLGMHEQGFSRPGRDCSPLLSFTRQFLPGYFHAPLAGA